jgi:hypothetical protein
MTLNQIADKLGYELKESKFLYKKEVYKGGVKIGDFNANEFKIYLKESREI